MADQLVYDGPSGMWVRADRATQAPEFTGIDTSGFVTGAGPGGIGVRIGEPTVPEAPQRSPQRMRPQTGALNNSPITNQIAGNYAVPRMNPNAWYNSWQGANPFSMTGSQPQAQQFNRAVSPGFVQNNMPSNFTGMSGQDSFQNQLAQLLAQYRWPLYF